MTMIMTTIIVLGDDVGVNGKLRLTKATTSEGKGVPPVKNMDCVVHPDFKKNLCHLERKSSYQTKISNL